MEWCLNCNHRTPRAREEIEVRYGFCEDASCECSENQRELAAVADELKRAIEMRDTALALHEQREAGYRKAIAERDALIESLRKNETN